MYCECYRNDLPKSSSNRGLQTYFHFPYHPTYCQSTFRACLPSQTILLSQYRPRDNSTMAPSTTSPIPGTAGLGSEMLQVAMAHLTSMKQQLEVEMAGGAPFRPNSATPTQEKEEEGEDDDDTSSDADSIFDDNASLSSRNTSIITFSELSVNTGDDEDTPIYAYKDLDDIFV
jgi:hypothetical protein